MKVTLNELKKIIESGKFEIKSYLPHIEKGILIDNICSAVISSDENGINEIDYVFLDVYTLFSVLTKYTDYEIEEVKKEDGSIDVGFLYELYDMFKQYEWDRISSIHLPLSISNDIGKDYETFINLLNKTLDAKLKLLNSAEIILKTSLSDFTQMINLNLSKLLEYTSPKNMEKTLKQLNKISPDKFPMINNLKSFVENLSKGDK